MADEEGQPAWLSKSSTSSSAPSAAPPLSSSASLSSSPSPPYKSVVTGTFLVINIGLMVFMSAVGALGIGESNSVNDTGTVFVGLYMIVFAAIVVVFEISQILPSQTLDLFMKKNFGFLYGYVGKGLFFIFIGILCFGLSVTGNQLQQMAYACGVLVAAWGPITVGAYQWKPEYFDKKEKYIP